MHFAEKKRESKRAYIIDMPLKYQRIGPTLSGGACICHWHRALFGYLLRSYPGDLMTPLDAVNSAGLP